jgi:arylsulfatase A-like enzyme
MQRRPNFLLFITDQHRADHLGCYGNRVVRTPNIDSIAARGARFDHFYVANAICMPNRATLMTGRMPSLHGVRYNGIPLSLEAVTFVELLAAAGYSTALVGKSHLQNFGYTSANVPRWTNANGGEPPPLALQQAVKDHRRGRAYDNEWTPHWRADPSFRVQTPFYGFQHVELCTDHADFVGGDYERWLTQRHPDPGSLRGRERAIPDARYSAPQTWRTRLPEELYPTSYIAERTVAWIENHAREAAERPFFLQCSFPDPHHPWTPPGRYWDMYSPDDIPLPPSFGQKELPVLARAVHERTRAGGSREGMGPPFAATERECREIIALNYGSISMIDDAVGRVLSAVAACGLNRDTVVVFTSDHGDFMGDHGIMLKGPVHYQGLIRVPFLWADPASPVSRVARSLAGTLDIAQTVLDRARIAPYHGIQGCSLLPAMRDESIPGRSGMLIEQEPTSFAFGRPQNFCIRTLVTERWRLTLSNDPAVCELYDLREDPHEMSNLWDSQEASAIRAQLTQQLAIEMLRHQDSAPLPTAMA